MNPQPIETVVGPEEITLYFCGQPGCEWQLALKPNPMMVMSAGVSAPSWQCPLHGLAVGPLRPARYVRKESS